MSARVAADGLRLRVLVEPRHGASYERLLAAARASEDAGFEAFFRSDHLFGVQPDDPALVATECWSTLAGLARDTATIALGSLVTAVTFRHPGLLAASVATVDAMSGGRVELGIGAAWYAREHAAYGVPFPPTGERFDRLGEALEILTGLWAATPEAPYSGHGVVANGTPVRPRRRPPIIIGGTGPRRTPALAARFADEFNAALGPEPVETRFARFDAACEAIGRDPATARRSAVLPVACGRTDAEAARRAEIIGSELMRGHAAIGPPDHVTDQLAALAKAGADTVYLHVYDIDDLDHLTLLAETIPPGGPR